MKKLIQVTVPPLDGTEFVVVGTINGKVHTGKYMFNCGLIYFDSGIISEDTLDGWVVCDNFIFDYRDGVDAKLFVVEE